YDGERQLARLEVRGAQGNRYGRSGNGGGAPVRNDRRTVGRRDGDHHAVGADGAGIVGHRQRQRMGPGREPRGRGGAGRDHRFAFLPLVAVDGAVRVVGAAAIEVDELDAVEVTVGEVLIGTGIGDRRQVRADVGERVRDVEAAVDGPAVEARTRHTNG